MRILVSDRYISIYDLYTRLTASTLGSHVKVYNSKMFYNLKVSSLNDYFCYYKFDNN